MNARVKLTECPRDAMQGFHKFIPTETKWQYLQLLEKVGFDVLDFGSFVNPKAMPQMADTHLLAERLNKGATRWLAIIGNLKGAKQAAAFNAISYVGFPYSISPTFLERNIKSSTTEAWNRILEIRDCAFSAGQTPLIYVSMAFGNPYNDPWSEDMVVKAVEALVEADIRHIALSDTIGAAEPENIENLFKILTSQFPEVELGCHFHTRPDNWKANIEAAWKGGCRKFDAAIRGFGGCPMAKDDLTGNLPTENLLEFLNSMNVQQGLDVSRFAEACALADSIFTA
jgi:hydroxymethylglutaryl-CoA lyase